MHTETDRAYLAGLIDGEGSIGIDAHGGHRVPSVRVTITNTNYPLLQEIHAIWGGALTTRRIRIIGWKASSDLLFGAKTAIEVLREIQPYLRAKKKQCDVALRFQETVNPPEHMTQRKTPEVVALREQLRRKILELNKRGTS